MPKISVIVPVYNVEQYIVRCVDSILSQTFSDFDLVLIDDGSPDNCGTICDSYAKQDTRINVLHKENGGLSEARNVGLDWVFSHSNSEWITFIDSDDWVHPQYLEALYYSILDTECCVAVCNFSEVYREKPGYSFYNNSSIILDSEKLFCEKRKIAVIACCKLYKKGLFSEIRFPPGKIHEDVFVTYKLLFACKKIVYIERDLYFYFQNPDSITKRMWSEKNKVIYDALDNQLLYFKKNGYDKAYASTLNAIAYVMSTHLSEMTNRNIDKNERTRLRRKLRTHLRKNKKIADFSISKNNPWYYEMAYPHFMKIYWMIKALFN